ncbi:hypothetical protein TEA_003647 [Camellia sinensis var. sinensis]|uniref:NAC domain-containing protein n=1 Tax=Camellia sinensis var. sinensis TaxID=542762 RepID=A0A4S4E4L9_CAMSN|nr:hypothetical protein TEA_003647 [Camellia sinensis var. sinensis]
MYGGASEVVRCFGLLTLELLQWVCSEFGSEQRCSTMELCTVAVSFELEKQWVLNRRFESEKQRSDRGSGDGCSNGGLARRMVYQGRFGVEVEGQQQSERKVEKEADDGGPAAEECSTGELGLGWVMVSQQAWVLALVACVGLGSTGELGVQQLRSQVLVSRWKKMNEFSRVPPGFRFHPSDEELVDYYLRKKITYRRIDLDIIKEVDLYKIEPWDLQELCRIGTEEQDEWYFFSHKDKKYPTGTRTNRATTAGFWKATGRDKAIYSKHNLIGMRKTLVFYKGRAPNGQKSDWIMHEYRLETDENGTSQAILSNDSCGCVHELVPYH